MQEHEFILTREFVELDNLLKLTGACDSGGMGKQLVAAGEVSVDGKVELRKTCKIRAGQVVTIGDARIAVLAAS
jgi:ribosome-associated protein